MASVETLCWDRHLDEFMTRIAGRFARPATWARARRVVGALIADLPRKNGWTLAEQIGEATPHGVQHLLGRAAWDEDGVACELRTLVAEQMGTSNGILVVDETGDLKKGTATVGTQRQYTGTAGRIENAQVAVYLGYATHREHALVDRELYLPKSWTSDPARCAIAGVPADVAFATKPALATALIERALDAGVSARWVTGDEVYGADPGLRAACEARGVGYVLAVASNARLPVGVAIRTPAQIAAELPARCWQTRSAGTGAKGERLYQWAWVHHDHHDDGPDDQRPEQGEEPERGVWSLLIRRHPRTGELAFYRAYSPRPVGLPALVAVAGRRWIIEESFQTGKELTGLDQHQVRRWTSWRRWTLLAMLAHALLAITTACARRHAHTGDNTDPDKDVGLIALTCNEVRRLVNATHTTVHDLAHTLAWSRWRRRHQHRARTAHYTRRETKTMINDLRL